MLYTDYLEHIENLNDDQAGKLFKAILAYATDGSTPSFKGALSMAFSFIKVQLDRDFEKYNEIVEKRREAGRRGGQKRSEQSQANQANANFVKQSQANQADNDNVNDTDNVTVNDTDTVSVINNNNTHTRDSQINKISFAEFVTMTNAEYNALIEKFGETDTKRMIEILDNHKGANGKVYDSDYRAILSWVTDRLKKEKQSQPNNMQSDNFNHSELEKLTRG